MWMLKQFLKIGIDRKNLESSISFERRGNIQRCIKEFRPYLNYSYAQRFASFYQTKRL